MSWKQIERRAKELDDLIDDLVNLFCEALSWCKEETEYESMLRRFKNILSKLFFICLTLERRRGK